MSSSSQQQIKPTAKPRRNVQAQQTKQQERVCELCEEATATNKCVECEQWICDRCKNLHSKQKATAHHKFTSLDAEQNDVVTALKGMLKSLDGKVAGLESHLDSYVCGQAKIESVKSDAIAKCRQLRRECHVSIDKRFDSLEARIDDVITPQLTASRDEQSQTISTLDDMRKLQTDIQSLLASSDRSMSDTEQALEKVKVMLEVKQREEVKVKVPRVRVEYNQAWDAVEPCRVVIDDGTNDSSPAGNDSKDAKAEAVAAAASTEDSAEEIKQNQQVRQLL